MLNDATLYCDGTAKCRRSYYSWHCFCCAFGFVDIRIGSKYLAGNVCGVAVCERQTNDIDSAHVAPLIVSSITCLSRKRLRYRITTQQ